MTKGVELYGRLNSQSFTGGSLNFFTEGVYTYSQQHLDEGLHLRGRRLNRRRLQRQPHPRGAVARRRPHAGCRGHDRLALERQRHLDLPRLFLHRRQQHAFWAGLRRSSTRQATTKPNGRRLARSAACRTVCLLSARFNLALGDTGASVFVSGDNLLDELYISDREDGMKPGLGRTIWTGFAYKF